MVERHEMALYHCLQNVIAAYNTVPKEYSILTGS